MSVCTRVRACATKRTSADAFKEEGTTAIARAKLRARRCAASCSICTLCCLQDTKIRFNKFNRHLTFHFRVPDIGTQKASERHLLGGGDSERPHEWARTHSLALKASRMHCSHRSYRRIRMRMPRWQMTSEYVVDGTSRVCPDA